MTNKLSKDTLETKKCLVVVSSKEQGIIYLTTEGRLTQIEHVEEHPLTHSDNEGFFVRSGNGQQMGSGSVKEVDEQHNIKRYIKAIAEELNNVVTHEKPEAILLFEPEHLKGLVEEHLTNSTHIPVQTIDFGNFIHESPQQIKDRIVAMMESDELDPADPASVEGEANAEEKRKILEVGKQLEGG